MTRVFYYTTYCIYVKNGFEGSRDSSVVALVSILDISANFFKFRKHLGEKCWLRINAQHGVA